MTVRLVAALVLAGSGLGPAMAGGLSPAAAQAVPELVVTEVSSSPAQGKAGPEGLSQVTLNGALKINEIEVWRKGAVRHLRLPEYRSSRTGRSYANFMLIHPAFRRALEQAVLKGPAGPAGPGGIVSRVTRMSPFDSPVSKRLANAEVTFNSALTVVCGVMRRDEEGDLWVSWPARRDTAARRWVPQFEFVRDDLRREVEDKILERYRAAVGDAPVAAGKLSTATRK